MSFRSFILFFYHANNLSTEIKFERHYSKHKAKERKSESTELVRKGKSALILLSSSYEMGKAKKSFPGGVNAEVLTRSFFNFKAF